jgi:hypothetical protein
MIAPFVIAAARAVDAADHHLKSHLLPVVFWPSSFFAGECRKTDRAIAKLAFSHQHGHIHSPTSWLFLTICRGPVSIKGQGVR